MKNLFNYATKELSQDTFLRWLFENYEEPSFKVIIVDFINTFTDGQKNILQPLRLKPEDITKIKTYTQEGKIDISIDIYTKMFGEHPRTIVVEDKTTSYEHNQLNQYNKYINKHWNYGNLTSDQCVYKVFYKTSQISGEEEKRVRDAGWIPFDINKIYNFFKKYKGTTDSDVLNDYIEHLEKIYNSYLNVSEESADKWTNINWKTFFETTMSKYQLTHNNLKYKFFTFRGIYCSMRVYLELEGFKYLKYTCLEMINRSNLIFYIHPGFRVDGEEEWSIEKFSENSAYELCKKEIEELRSMVQILDYKDFKRANTTKAFAKTDIEIEYKDKYANDIEKKLYEFLNTYINFIKDIKHSLTLFIK